MLQLYGNQITYKCSNQNSFLVKCSHLTSLNVFNYTKEMSWKPWKISTLKWSVTWNLTSWRRERGLRELNPCQMMVSKKSSSGLCSITLCRKGRTIRESKTSLKKVSRIQTLKLNPRCKRNQPESMMMMITTLVQMKKLRKENSYLR